MHNNTCLSHTRLLLTDRHPCSRNGTPPTISAPELTLLDNNGCCSTPPPPLPPPLPPPPHPHVQGSINSGQVQRARRSNPVYSIVMHSLESTGCLLFIATKNLPLWRTAGYYGESSLPQVHVYIKETHTNAFYLLSVSRCSEQCQITSLTSLER